MISATRFGLLASILALAPLSSAQLPQLAPRIDLAGDAAVGPATGDQNACAIARGGGGYLVAWADRRTKLSTYYGQSALGETALDIWALRLDATGKQLESVPFPLDLAPGEDTAPEIAWNGQHWLVTWVSQAPLGSIYASAIVGVRVAPDGQVLDAPPIVLLGYPSSAVSSYAVATDAQNWVVVAQGSSAGSNDTVAVRLSASGVVLDPTPRSILPAGQLVGAFDLAYAQGVFLLVWSDTATATGWDVFGLRFDSALQLLGPTAFPIAATDFNDFGASVATSGAQFLVGFERYVTSTFQADIQAVRVTPAGTLLDPTPIALTPNLPYGNAMGTTVAWDGGQWYVAWAYSGLHLARVSAAGLVLDFGGFDFDPSAPFASMSGPRLAGATPSGVQMVWTDRRAGSYEGEDVYTSRIVDAGSIGPQAPLSLGTSAQLDADLATDGTNHALVFRSETSGERRILLSRLGPGGNPLDPEPIEIASGLFESYPAVAFTGGVYLVTWERASDSTVFARRMAPDGTLLDATPLVVGNGSTPEVAGLNGDFLVVWTRAQAYPHLRFPCAVRVRAADGAVLGAPLVINSNYAQFPDVSVLGGRWAMVWQRNWSHDNPWADVQGAFVEPTGALGSTFYVGGTLSTYNYLPQIAASASEALIVWQSGPHTGYARRVLARRMLPDGTFLDAGGFQVVAGVAPQQVRPKVAWDGEQYLVAFEDTRASNVMLDERTDVYGARVRTDGLVLDPAGFAIATDVVPEHSPALIGRGGSAGLVACSSFRPETPLGSYRIGVQAYSGVCPPVTAYCTAKVTSGGCTPAAFSAGVPSLAAPAGFVFGARKLPPNKAALMFFGTSGRSAIPFQGGLLCVKPPLLRLPTKSSGGATACQGSIRYTLAELLAHPVGGPLVSAGATVDAQAWFRDSVTTSPTGLSDGIEFSVCP